LVVASQEGSVAAEAETGAMDAISRPATVATAAARNTLLFFISLFLVS